MSDPSLVTALAPLRGLSVWAAGAAADLLWLQLGAAHSVVAQVGPARGEPRLVGEYALHLQCPWHLAAPSGARLIDHTTAGAAAALDAWLRAHQPCLVDDLTGLDHHLVLTLAGGHTLHLCPAPGPAEQLRLLQPGRPTPHLVYPASSDDDVCP